MPTAAGLHYFVHEEQNVARPPVILIHGAGGTHLNWPAQVRRLPDQRMFALDLPGHGKSDGMGRQAVDEYAEDILGFMDAVKLNAAIMVGHSMGAALALALALDHPQHVLGLGLVGSASRLRVAPAILRGIANPLTFHSALHLITESSYGPSADPRLKELAEQRMAETRATVLYGDFLASDSFDAQAALQRVRVPTVILCGLEDRMAPPDCSRQLHRAIAGSELRLIPDAGHMLMIERPDAVAQVLTDFLSGVPYRPGQ
ncbi:MAG TPA: alpha/beta hydrolase [Anaerolineales bacterium]